MLSIPNKDFSLRYRSFRNDKLTLNPIIISTRGRDLYLDLSRMQQIPKQGPLRSTLLKAYYAKAFSCEGRAMKP